MKTIDLVQGSAEWHAHRANYRNASEAPAAMGVSPYMTRSELVKAIATGIRPEPTPFQLDNFAEGHRAEGLYRPRAEEIVGDDLYPCVGVEGNLSASFDGLRMNERENFEHKLLNDDIRAAFDMIEQLPDDEREREAGRLLPTYHQVQMEQQCMVAKCERVLFAASRWSPDGVLLEERWCWYYPNPELAERIKGAWAQVEVDAANYVPEVTPVKVKGKAPEALPAVLIELQGRVLATNIDEYKATAIAVFENINRDLKTDSDFADAEKTVAWCKDIEERLEAAKQHALSQTSSIETLFRDIDEIIASSKDTRLDLKKLVDRRKEEIKGEIVAEGVTGLAEHIAELNAAIGRPYMPKVPADFGGAIKGKRNVDMMRDAVRTLLANTKIEASRIATGIQTNMGTLREQAGEKYAHLFPDTHTIVLKACDDFATLVKLRINEHEAKEAKRLEDERERIRKEEAARVEREQAAQLAAQQRAADEAAAKKAAEERQRTQTILGEIQGIRQQAVIAITGRLGVRKGGTIECIRETLAETEAWVIDDRFAEFKEQAQAAKAEAIATILELLRQAESKAAEPPPPPAPAPVAQAELPVESPAPAPAEEEAPTLKLGDINARLGLLSVSADNLAGLGFPGVKKGAARCYRESDYDAILFALGGHLRSLRDARRKDREEREAATA